MAPFFPQDRDESLLLHQGEVRDLAQVHDRRRRRNGHLLIEHSHHTTGTGCLCANGDSIRIAQGDLHEDLREIESRTKTHHFLPWWYYRWGLQGGSRCSTVQFGKSLVHCEKGRSRCPMHFAQIWENGNEKSFREVNVQDRKRRGRIWVHW